MRLTDQALKEFEALWQQDHPDHKLTEDQLRAMATRVLLAVEIAGQPIPLDQIEPFNKRCHSEQKPPTPASLNLLKLAARDPNAAIKLQALRGVLRAGTSNPSEVAQMLDEANQFISTSSTPEQVLEETRTLRAKIEGL